MAYSGYLVKIGTYIIPNNLIVLKTYKAAYNIQDLDPYRDGNGVLHRNALPHVPPKVEFQIKPGLTNTKFDIIMNNIRGQYTIPAERKGVVSIFIPELGNYVETNAYMPDPEISIIRIENSSTVIYDAITLKFIGY